MSKHRTQTFASGLVSSMLAMVCFPAFAGDFDMTSLNPFYQTTDGAFHSGVSPYYSASSTTNSVTLVGQVNLPNDLGAYENTNFPLTSGDFLASVTLSISANSGGFFNAVTNTGYFGFNRNNYGVWGNYGVGFGNVNTPTIPVPTDTISYTLSRAGDSFNAYASFGSGYVKVLSLVGPSITGAMGLSLGVRGIPGIDAPEITTFENLSFFPGVSSDLNDFSGGTAESPVMLPATPVDSVSADIGPGGPDSNFYSFYWKGGAFSAAVSVPDAAALISPPSYSFELCDGTTCEDILQQTVADSNNSWSSSLGGDLAPGFYTIGIAELTAAAEDPPFTITFATPISQIVGTPELSTWAMVIVGFVGVAFAAHRKAREQFCRPKEPHPAAAHRGQSAKPLLDAQAQRQLIAENQKAV
jgi:hypothetical protein